MALPVQRALGVHPDPWASWALRESPVEMGLRVHVARWVQSVSLGIQDPRALQECAARWGNPAIPVLRVKLETREEGV